MVILTGKAFGPLTSNLGLIQTDIDYYFNSTKIFYDRQNVPLYIH